MMGMETRISPGDRLGLTLFVAFTLHAVIILGTAFQIDPPQRQPPPDQVLEITVVRNPRPAVQPEQADFLSQVAQEGGGEEEQRLRPTTQEPAPPPLVETPPQPPAEPMVATPPPRLTPPPEPETAPETAAPVPVVAAAQPVENKVERKPDPPKKPPKRETPPPEDPVPPVEPPRLSSLSAAAILAQTSAEIDRLSAELDRKTEAYAKRPRTKTISAATQEFRYATYMEAWRKKVEQIGNLNYPEEARRQGLFGSLILIVVLRPDGHVESIEVRQSSGHKALDDAARRIVEFSAPFAPFPPEMRQETDLLVITRTWQFLPSNRLFAQ
jgi:periplasmic protein TonB